jgi:hypothetical protein
MTNNLKLSLIVVLSCWTVNSTAQDEIDTTAYVEEESSELIEQTFQSTRIINGHSVEHLRKGVLEFRVEHHFGDLAGTKGGVQNWFGIDDAADIRLAFEYGITDNLMVGVGRSKGSGQPYRSLIDGFAKYRILHQKRHGMPISLGILGTMTYTYQKKSTDIYSVAYFPKQVHRFSYSGQLNIARKFGSWLSLAVMPTVVHRNYVAQDDANTLFSVGGAMRVAVTKKMAILAEYYQVVADNSIRQRNYNSLSFAVEWITFGHNFTVYLTNARGFGESQFITNTFDNWLKGQFRIGFCIGRKFEFGD